MTPPQPEAKERHVTTPGSLAARQDPYAAFNFQIEIEGLVVGGFSEVGGLQLEIETEDYREGGLNDYVHKLAGPARYPQNLTLKRGLTDADALWSWQYDAARGIITRRNATIYLLNRAGAAAMSWDVLAAYPVRWTGPDLRAGSSEIAFEAIDLVHRGIVKAPARRHS
jgi:phage tail-like protein